MRKPFSLNMNRFDPYKAYRFLVYFGTSTSPVAAVSKVGSIKRSSDPIEYKSGGDPIIRKGLGRTKYEAITLERGVTHDHEFEHWASKVWTLGAGPGAEASLKDFRKDVRIEFYNEAGQLALAYHVYRCWVSEYQVSLLEPGARAFAVERLRLENDGWERI